MHHIFPMDPALIGQRKALAIAVRNQGGRRRWSKGLSPDNRVAPPL